MHKEKVTSRQKKLTDNCLRALTTGIVVSMFDTLFAPLIVETVYDK